MTGNTEILRQLQGQVEQQERRLQAQQRRIDELEQLRGSPTDDPRSRSANPTHDSSDASNSVTTSRRTAMRHGAAAIGAGIVGAVALSRPAEAADGGNLIIGQTNNASSVTRLNTTGTAALSLDATGQNGTTLIAEAPTTGPDPWAIQGKSTTAGAAIVGFATSEAVAFRAFASKAQLELVPTTTSPLGRTTAHRRGMQVFDTSGDLWTCVADGTPGTWRKISGPSTAGAIHAIEPGRVYDSRFTDGAISQPQSRIISVANGINITTGAVIRPGMVPPGATSVTFNLAVVNTVGPGFLSVTPGNASNFFAAAINWFGSGQILNNGSMSSVDALRQLRVWAGGTTNFVIDITSYTL